MRRPRPYIPISARLEVAERQVQAACAAGMLQSVWWPVYQSAALALSGKKRLDELLNALGGVLGDALELDHDPALILRPFKPDRRKPQAAWFEPNANDPDYLFYRPIREHQQKTTGRKADATHTVTTKGSDIWLKSKFNRLEGKTRRRPKQKIPARKSPWPKGRSLPSRKRPNKS
jgi:hypothetical protein